MLFSFSKLSNFLGKSTTITWDSLELSVILFFNFLEISILVSDAFLLKPLAFNIKSLTFMPLEYVKTPG